MELKSVVFTRLILRQFIHEKSIFIFLFVYFLFFAFSAFVDYFNPEEQVKFIQDFGISLFSFSSFLLVIFGATYIFDRKESRKTDLIWLTKPIWKFQLLWGKVNGVAAVLTANLVLAALVLTQVTYFKYDFFSLSLLMLLALVFIKYLILLAWVVFLSNFFDRLLVLFLSVTVYLLSNALVFLNSMTQQLENVFYDSIFFLLKLILPRFDYFNLIESITLGRDIPLPYFLKSSAYGFVYFVVLILIATFFYTIKER